ncbi:MAG: alanine racemase [Burkholderiaceae bacterium]
MPRPLSAIIDIDAMQCNLALAKSCVPDARAWAVVKANAYGHGLEFGMRGFAAADGLALIEIDGAVQLREMGWAKPILLLEGFFHPADLKTITEYRLETVVHCNEQLEIFEKTSGVSGVAAHLKMNSGMNRLGFKPEQFPHAYERLSACKAVNKISLLTHFANAEFAAHEVLSLADQMHVFREAARELPGERSCSNSAAILVHRELRSDWIRPGIMLYGASPGGRSAAEFGLRPAMRLESEIIGIQNVLPGESVGYGSLFVADRPMKIGVVACGYADGYPRHAPTGTPVLVDGVKTRLLGRVSMDMMNVDLTTVPQAQLGSKVVLWGDTLPVDEVAHAAGTIGYELMCALTPRVKRVPELRQIR